MAALNKTKKQLLDSFVNYKIVRKEGRLIKAGDLLFGDFLFKDGWSLHNYYKIEIHNKINKNEDADWQTVHRVVHSYYADGSTDVDLFFDFGTVQINGQNRYDVKEKENLNET